MKHWIQAMLRLQAVQQSRENFLVRDFIDRAIIGPMLLDRLAADVCAADAGKLTLPTLQPGQGSADDRLSGTR